MIKMIQIRWMNSILEMDTIVYNGSKLRTQKVSLPQRYWKPNEKIPYAIWSQKEILAWYLASKSKVKILCKTRQAIPDYIPQNQTVFSSSK